MQNVEMSALKTLRSGFFYLLVAMTMLIVVTVMPTTFTYLSSLVGMISMAIFIIVLLLSTVVLFLYAIFGKIRPGMRQLSEVDNGFRICYTGTTLMLVGLAMLAFGAGIGIVVGVAMAVRFAEMENVIGMVLALGWFYASYIIAFVGYLLTFVVGAFKLYRKYRNPLYAFAGVLFVLKIFLTFVGLHGLDAVLTLAGLGIAAVGYVLMYIALGNTIKNTQS
jgi:hypothetical protein